MAAITSTNKRSIVTGKIESNAVYEGENGSENSYMRWRYDTLSDNKFLSIELKTSTFVEPKYLGFIGFGLGWLYNQPLGAPMENHTCKSASGIKSIYYENTVGNEQRHIELVGGRRYLKTQLYPLSNPTMDAGGMVEFPAGATILAGETSFMFSTVRITHTRPTDSTGYQVKQDRINMGFGLDNGENLTYIKQKSGANVNTGGVLAGASSVHTNGSGGDYDLDANAPIADGYLTDFAWVWKMNTPDVKDGYQHVLISKNGTTLVDTPFYASGAASGNGYPAGVISTFSPNRPDTMKWQDHIANNDGPQAREIELIRTDMMCQVNGTRVWIGDASTITACTGMIPLIPLLYESTTKWHFNLWKGSLASYSGAYIYIVDDLFNVVSSAPLGA